MRKAATTETEARQEQMAQRGQEEVLMKKWADTIASGCRYGDVAERIFKDAEIIWEHSEADYQGYANVLARLKNGHFIHLSWTYGSCSGCDEWEARGLSDDDVEQEMRRSMGVFKTQKHLRKYCHLEDKTAKVPCPNDPTNGSIPGMLYMGFGGFASDFRSMARTVETYLKSRKPKPKKKAKKIKKRKTKKR